MNDNIVRHELAHLKSSWWMYFILGILLVFFGATAISVPAATIGYSFAAVLVLGVSLMAAGTLVIIGAIMTGRWGGNLPLILMGIFYLVAGFIISDHLEGATKALTLFIGASFMVTGLFRIVVALSMRFPQWGWTLISGVVSFLAGYLIYKHFPESSLWVIGLIVGIEMLFHGVNWIMLSLAVRNLPEANV